MAIKEGKDVPQKQAPQGPAQQKPIAAIPSQAAEPPKALPIGLTSQEAGKLLAQHGENRLRFFKRSEPLRLFLSQFQYPLLILVISAALLATLKPAEGISIILFVLLTAVIETWRTIAVEDSVITSEMKYAGDTVVLRDGVRKRIPAFLIVPGDIVFLKEGMRVPGDGIIIRATDCTVDESVFDHGVSAKVPEREVEKTFKLPLSDPSTVYAGTYVASGECMVRITGTGDKTKYFTLRGIRQPLMVEMKGTDAIARVKRATDSFSPVVYVVALLIVIALYFNGVLLFSAIVIGAAAAVAGIPQTIFSVASSLAAMTMERMSERIGVRRERVVDNIGKTTLICTEQLGALSRNEPTAKHLWIDRKDIEITGEGWDTLGSFKGAKRFASIDMLTEMAAAATSAEIEFIDDRRIMTGDLKEGALTIMAMKNRQPIETLRGEWNVFSRKTDENGVRTVGIRKGRRTTFVAYGPADAVTQRCKSLYSDGKFLKIDEKLTSEMEQKKSSMAAEGHEVWGFAFAWKRKEPSNFVFLGLLGIHDPPKKELNEAIELAASAGIRTIVMTHESSTLAVQFARRIGILKPGMRAVVCDELKYMRPEERKRVILGSVVFAEAAPEHEIMILDELKANGENVTFIESLGNDAKPMSHANIAIATESANDVLKFNSDGVLLNDSFGGILNVIEESRAMRQSIERSFYALFASDLSILLTVLMGVVVFTGGVMGALQILLVNLVSDTAIGVGFAKNRVRQMSIKKRTSRKFPSLVEYTFALILAIAMAVSVAVLTTAPIANGYESSIAMAALTVGIISFMANWESAGEPIIRILPRLSSRVILSMAIVLGITLIVLYIPQVNSIFGYKPLTQEHWKQIVLVAPLLTILFELKKRFVH